MHIIVPPPGTQKPSWHWSFGGQSEALWHMPPPPPGMQKPNRQAVPAGQGSPLAHD